MNRPSGEITIQAALAACFLFLTGCGGNPDGIVFAPVSGRLTINGEPAANIRVTFEPRAKVEGGVVGTGSQAVTKQDGSFTLTTATGQIRRAAVVGEHTVAFSGAEDLEGDLSNYGIDPEDAPTFAIPEDAKITSFTVPRSGTSEADFEIDGAEKVRW